MNLIPLVSSNLWAARMSPRLPSLMRSESGTPWFWYFFATDTTNRRLERTSLSSAPSSFARIRLASSASSSRLMSGYWLISLRYWSRDPSLKAPRREEKLIVGGFAGRGRSLKLAPTQTGRGRSGNGLVAQVELGRRG